MDSLLVCSNMPWADEPETRKHPKIGEGQRRELIFVLPKPLGRFMGRGGERRGSSRLALTQPVPMNRSADLRSGAGKAALKPPALQTLTRGTERPQRREASGVRAASAPLWLADGSHQGFRGSRREIFFRGILSSVLSPLLRRGERKKKSAASKPLSKKREHLPL